MPQGKRQPSSVLNQAGFALSSPYFKHPHIVLTVLLELLSQRSIVLLCAAEFHEEQSIHSACTEFHLCQALFWAEDIMEETLSSVPWRLTWHLAHSRSLRGDCGLRELRDQEVRAKFQS